MEGQFQTLFDNLKIEMQKQNEDLKQSVTKNILDKMEEKLIPIVEENKNLKVRVEKLEKEIEYLKKGGRENNIIVFGLDEKETSTIELLREFKENLKIDLNINMEDYEINKIYRLGKKNRESNKPRPVLCSFINNWKKMEIIKNKKHLKKIHVSEDYSKEVLEKRKTLQADLAEERKKGNIAYLRHDKLIIKETNNNSQEKRKRESSASPSDYNNQPKKQLTVSTTKTNRTNAFDMMRSSSLSNISTTKKQ
ncbi:uncharacterized protein LOC134791063 [Cydia splendana]|uniref:uncharacterized protein LOC134791063 n=1 Tax=Cydia splendana TaxID=1100963 RepID=UPI00300D0092